ncbi:zinc knuckle CX2CX4HX4C containing protein [Tanacetum coccineum]
MTLKMTLLMSGICDILVSVANSVAIPPNSCSGSSYDKAMIELRANVKLKDTIVLAMPKLVGEGFYMCTIRVEYEWKPLKCSSCKVFGHVLDKCPKNIVLDVMKNLKNPRQAARGVQVGPNVGFKPTKQVINLSLIRTMPTLVVKRSKLRCLEKIREGGNTVVSPFDHGFFHVASSSTSTIPIVERIDKLEKQIIDGKRTLADDNGKPLPKVIYG